MGYYSDDDYHSESNSQYSGYESEEIEGKKSIHLFRIVNCFQIKNRNIFLF